MQVVLSGFSVRLFCFVQTKSLCGDGCQAVQQTLMKK